MTVFLVFEWYDNSEPYNPVKSLDGVFEDFAKAQEYVLQQFEKLKGECNGPDRWIIEEIALNSVSGKEVATLDRREPEQIDWTRFSSSHGKSSRSRY